MNKKYAFVLIAIALLAVLLAAFDVDSKIIALFDVDIFGDVYYDESGIVKENGYYYSKYGKIKETDWNSYYSESSGFKNIYHFLYTIDNYVKKIMDLTGMYDWQQIQKDKYSDNYYFDQYINISFTENNQNISDVSTYLKLSIALNKENFINNYSTLAHDIAIIIADKSASQSLTEGFGFYIQDEIGLNLNCFNYGIDIYTVSKDYIIDENKDIINNLGSLSVRDFSDRQKAYNILSSSFTRYLIDNYGIDNFMKIYLSDNTYKEIHNVCDKSLAEIRDEWIKYVQNYKSYEDLARDILNDKVSIKKVGTIKSNDDISGSLKNRNYFILEQSFYNFIKAEYGIDKYNAMIFANGNYELVFKKNLSELKDEWLSYLRNR